MKPTTTKERSLSTLVHELDKLVSEVVRLGSADSQGYVKCLTCDIRIHWKQSQCAHFIHRSNMSTRFNLDNLAACCPDCNVFGEAVHLAKWEEIRGSEWADNMRRQGHSTRKLMRFELEKGIELMSLKLKELRK